MRIPARSNRKFPSVSIRRLTKVHAVGSTTRVICMEIADASSNFVCTIPSHSGRNSKYIATIILYSFDLPFLDNCNKIFSLPSRKCRRSLCIHVYMHNQRRIQQFFLILLHTDSVISGSIVTIPSRPNDWLHTSTRVDMAETIVKRHQGL